MSLCKLDQSRTICALPLCMELMNSTINLGWKVVSGELFEALSAARNEKISRRSLESSPKAVAAAALKLVPAGIPSSYFFSLALEASARSAFESMFFRMRAGVALCRMVTSMRRLSPAGDWIRRSGLRESSMLTLGSMVVRVPAAWAMRTSELRQQLCLNVTLLRRVLGHEKGWRV